MQPTDPVQASGQHPTLLPTDEGMAPERWELALYCAGFVGAIVASAWWPGVWGA